jgi:predicted GNAT family N-acyltransferase
MNDVLEDLIIYDDIEHVDLNLVHHLLSTTYWAKDRALGLIEKSIKNSLPISVYHDGSQIAFARVVTDKACFAWICDVIVHEDYRGKGIGKTMLAFIQSHSEIPKSMQLLRTHDAHKLYEQFGFTDNVCMTK